ncbi:hypothetical protein FBQ87_04795 [Sphingobacteriales bacterium CHB3]|nr:hypothetical protein [Sphingobacteriales bacterium CHB3]
MRLFPRKLWLQLILPLMILVMLTGIIAAFVHMKTQEAQLLDAMITGADQLSGSIVSATWHAMLADQRESAYEIMETIATKQGINRIRIFNKEGRVMFSTAANDTGQVNIIKKYSGFSSQSNTHQHQCVGKPLVTCHLAGTPLFELNYRTEQIILQQ